MRGRVAGQRGAQWSADGGCPNLRPGPARLLPGLRPGLQSGSAQPRHYGNASFSEFDHTFSLFRFDLNHHGAHFSHLANKSGYTLVTHSTVSQVNQVQWIVNWNFQCSVPRLYLVMLIIIHLFKHRGAFYLCDLNIISPPTKL